MEKWLVLDTEHMRIKAVLCSQQDAIKWQELCCSGVASTVLQPLDVLVLRFTDGQLVALYVNLVGHGTPDKPRMATLRYVLWQMLAKVPYTDYSPAELGAQHQEMMMNDVQLQADEGYEQDELPSYQYVRHSYGARQAPYEPETGVRINVNNEGEQFLWRHYATAVMRPRR